MRQRIQKIADEMGLSLNAMSKELGFTPSYLSRVISGKNSLTPRLISLICSTYDVSESWFRSGNGEMFTIPAEPDQAQIALDFVKSIIADLSEPNRKIVWDAIQQLRAENFFGDETSPAPDQKPKKPAKKKKSKE